jgi:hypothetical protein
MNVEVKRLLQYSKARLVVPRLAKRSKDEHAAGNQAMAAQNALWQKKTPPHMRRGAQSDDKALTLYPLIRD